MIVVDTAPENFLDAAYWSTSRDSTLRWTNEPDAAREIASWLRGLDAGAGSPLVIDTEAQMHGAVELVLTTLRSGLADGTLWLCGPETQCLVETGAFEIVDGSSYPCDGKGAEFPRSGCLALAPIARVWDDAGARSAAEGEEWLFDVQPLMGVVWTFIADGQAEHLIALGIGPNLADAIPELMPLDIEVITEAKDPSSWDMNVFQKGDLTRFVGNLIFALGTDIKGAVIESTMTETPIVMLS